jgi:uncharacterized protein HemY
MQEPGLLLSIGLALVKSGQYTDAEPYLMLYLQTNSSELSVSTFDQALDALVLVYTKTERHVEALAISSRCCL